MAIHPGEGCEGRRLSGKEGASVAEEEKVAARWICWHTSWLVGWSKEKWTPCGGSSSTRTLVLFLLIRSCYFVAAWSTLASFLLDKLKTLRFADQW